MSVRELIRQLKSLTERVGKFEVRRMCVCVCVCVCVLVCMCVCVVIYVCVLGPTTDFSGGRWKKEENLKE